MVDASTKAGGEGSEGTIDELKSALQACHLLSSSSCCGSFCCSACPLTTASYALLLQALDLTHAPDQEPEEVDHQLLSSLHSTLGTIYRSR